MEETVRECHNCPHSGMIQALAERRKALDFLRSYSKDAEAVDSLAAEIATDERYLTEACMACAGFSESSQKGQSFVHVGGMPAQDEFIEREMAAEVRDYASPEEHEMALERRSVTKTLSPEVESGIAVVLGKVMSLPDDVLVTFKHVFNGNDIPRTAAILKTSKQVVFARLKKATKTGGSGGGSLAVRNDETEGREWLDRFLKSRLSAAQLANHNKGGRKIGQRQDGRIQTVMDFDEGERDSRIAELIKAHAKPDGCSTPSPARERKRP